MQPAVGECVDHRGRIGAGGVGDPGRHRGQRHPLGEGDGVGHDGAAREGVVYLGKAGTPLEPIGTGLDRAVQSPRPPVYPEERRQADHPALSEDLRHVAVRGADRYLHEHLVGRSLRHAPLRRPYDREHEQPVACGVANPSALQQGMPSSPYVDVGGLSTGCC